MSVLNKQEFFDKLHTFIGDNSSEDAISFMEDVTDTYNDMESKSNGDGEDWKRRYEENDAAWKAKYRHRFFSSDGGNYDERMPVKEEVTAENIKIDDLFIRKEK